MSRSRRLPAIMSAALLGLLAPAATTGCGGGGSPTSTAGSAKRPPASKVVVGPGRLVPIGGGRSLYLHCVGSAARPSSSRPASAATATTGTSFIRASAASRGPAPTIAPGSATAWRSRACTTPPRRSPTCSGCCPRRTSRRPTCSSGIPTAACSCGSSRGRIPPDGRRGAGRRHGPQPGPALPATVARAAAAGPQRPAGPARARRRRRRPRRRGAARREDPDARAHAARRDHARTRRRRAAVPRRTRRAVGRLWTTMQDELAGLSTDRVHVVAVRSGHFVQGPVDGQPAVVVAGVRAVVDAARTGKAAAVVPARLHRARGPLPQLVAPAYSHRRPRRSSSRPKSARSVKHVWLRPSAAYRGKLLSYAGRTDRPRSRGQ